MVADDADHQEEEQEDFPTSGGSAISSTVVGEQTFRPLLPAVVRLRSSLFFSGGRENFQGLTLVAEIHQKSFS